MSTLRLTTWSKMLKGILVSSVVVLLSGCNDDVSDLERYVNTVHERPVATIEPIPAIKPYVRFVYPENELDPFDVSSVKHENESAPAVSSVAVDENRTREFLERFPLENLHMVGTVYRDKELWALIQIPDGAIHRVKKGNYLGNNQGKIINIEEAKIQLQEIVSNGFGGYKEQEGAITLYDSKKNG